MSHIALQSIGTILDNYADVIEGGNAYRGGGTPYLGIPGTHSFDPGLMSGEDTPLICSGKSTSTEITIEDGDWPEERWVKQTTPGFFALCTAVGGEEPETNTSNIDCARRILGWNNDSVDDDGKIMTVDAFPTEIYENDTFTILQGFKRIPDNIEIDSDDVTIESGFDRFFHLYAEAGEQLEWYGAGVVTYSTILQIRLRFLKHSRASLVRKSAFENMAIIRGVLCSTNPEHRDGTYVRALLPTGQQSQIVREDRHKIVIMDQYRLIYRISTTFK